MVYIFDLGKFKFLVKNDDCFVKFKNNSMGNFFLKSLEKNFPFHLLLKQEKDIINRTIKYNRDIMQNQVL